MTRATFSVLYIFLSTFGISLIEFANKKQRGTPTGLTAANFNRNERWILWRLKPGAGNYGLST